MRCVGIYIYIYRISCARAQLFPRSIVSNSICRADWQTTNLQRCRFDNPFTVSGGSSLTLRSGPTARAAAVNCYLTVLRITPYRINNNIDFVRLVADAHLNPREFLQNGYRTKLTCIIGFFVINKNSSFFYNIMHKSILFNNVSTCGVFQNWRTRLIYMQMCAIVSFKLISYY